MNAREAIKNSIQTADMVCGMYLEDLTDAEMMQRPHAGCNHINWQVGHLIASDNNLANSSRPGSLPDLPAGFAEKYSKETASNDDAGAFCSKEELMSICKTQRTAVLNALDGMTDDELDAESPEEMRGYAPNVGAAFNMLGGHWMMHAGQWVVLRRQLGRDIVI